MDGNMWSLVPIPHSNEVSTEWICLRGRPPIVLKLLLWTSPSIQERDPTILNWIGNGWEGESSMVQRWYDSNQRGFSAQKWGSRIENGVGEMGSWFSQIANLNYEMFLKPIEKNFDYKTQLREVKGSIGNLSYLHRKFPSDREGRWVMWEGPLNSIVLETFNPLGRLSSTLL